LGVSISASTPLESLSDIRAAGDRASGLGKLLAARRSQLIKSQSATWLPLDPSANNPPEFARANTV